jgi:SAM-dependent methyltransferase
VINWLHSRFHDPTGAWDPIAPEYARRYADEALADVQVVEQFRQAMGNMAGLQVADLASGPGQYALEFARLGARVTCIDVSRTYLRIAESRMRVAGFDARFLVGYIDHVDRLAPQGFDGIFSNISWNYCMNDFSFARHLLAAVKPGGTIFVRETNESYVLTRGRHRRLIYGINRHLGIKFGHPHPPRGRIAAAFARAGNCEVSVDNTSSEVDLVTVRRR